MQAEQNVRVFRLNDYEWFAGEDLESCIRSYFKDYLGEEDTPEGREEYIEEPYELSAEQMDDLTFTDMDGQLFGDDPPGTQFSFREVLDKMIETQSQFPILFASTEY